MTHTYRRAAAACWTILAFTLLSPSAPAQDLTIRNVADSTQPFRILTRPSINDAGVVAFGGAENGTGFIYRGLPGATLTPSPLPNGFTPFRVAVGESGTATVLGSPSAPLIQVAPDGTVTVVQDNSGPLSNILHFAAPRSGTGQVVYEAIRDGEVGHGVYRSSDRLDNPTAHSSTELLGLGRDNAPRFMANRAGSSSRGVFDGPDVVNDMILDLSNFTDVQHYTENVRGDALFIATDRGSGVTGLFNGPDPVANSVTDTTDALWPVRSFLNDNGQMVILGQVGQTGTAALYSGTNPATDRLFGVGDPLFGSTLQSFGFNLADQEAFNNRGELAFGYTLANGVTGVAVLTVPEPVGVAAALGSAVLMYRRRR